jgi:hypothetical protein
MPVLRKKARRGWKDPKAEDSVLVPVKKLETIEQRMAFEEFWNMGDARTQEKIADKIDRNINTIKKWYREFGWAERVRERQERLLDRLLLETEEETVKTKKLFLSIIKKAAENSCETDPDGNITATKITPKNVIELKILHEFYNEVLGVSSGNGRVTQQGNTNIAKATFIIKK